MFSPPSELGENGSLFFFFFFIYQPFNVLNSHLELIVARVTSQVYTPRVVVVAGYYILISFFSENRPCLNCKFDGLQLMFTFEQRIKAGPIRSVLYPKIIKETFKVSEKGPNYFKTFETVQTKYKVGFK